VGVALADSFIASVKVFTDVGGALVDALGPLRRGRDPGLYEFFGHAAEKSGAESRRSKGGLAEDAENLSRQPCGSKPAYRGIGPD